MRETYQAQYHELLEELLRHGEPIVNRRTSQQTAAIHGGFSLSVDLSSGALPLTCTRRLYPKSAFAEVAWQLMGTRHIEWLRKHCPMWDKFVDHTDVVMAAYGYRWRVGFGRDQLQAAVDTLRNDPTDRQCVVMAWNPMSDGLGELSQWRNVPCPIGFTVNIVGGRMHMSVFMRSSDVFVGLPYDVMGHALLLDTLAASTGVRPGILHFMLAHAHLYEVHRDMAQECVHAWGERREVESYVPLPGWDMAVIYAQPDAYVELGKLLTRMTAWPDYAPKPEVVL